MLLVGIGYYSFSNNICSIEGVMAITRKCAHFLPYCRSSSAALAPDLGVDVASDGPVVRDLPESRRESRPSGRA